MEDRMSKWKWAKVPGGWRVTDTEREREEAEALKRAYNSLQNISIWPDQNAALSALQAQQNTLNAAYGQMISDVALWNRYANALQGKPMGPFLPAPKPLDT